MVVYTYLRLTMDHTSHMLINLRKREVDLCVSLLREKVRLIIVDHTPHMVINLWKGNIPSVCVCACTKEKGIFIVLIIVLF